MPVQVALAHKHLTGGEFDLPVVGPVFKDYVALVRAERAASRSIPGDFFKDPIPQADVISWATSCTTGTWPRRGCC